MPTRVYVIPIPPGNTEALKSAFAEMEGAREQQCIDNRQVMGITREFVSLQETAQGDLLVAYLEGDDPDKAVERMVAYLEGDDPDKAVERMVASGSDYARWIAEVVFPLLGTEYLSAAQVLADWRDR